MRVRRSCSFAGAPAAVVALVAAVLLAGCGGGLPDSGRAGAGRDVGDVSSEPLQVAPQGPRPGAGPEEVVGGFLHAGAGFDADHTVARSFLAGGAASAWRPDQRTVVYPDDTSLSVTAVGSGPTRDVVVQAPVWATIDAAGQFALAAPGARATTRLTVSLVQRQWRVVGLASDFGLWMPRYEFERAYTPVRLHYVASGTRVLVPDLRWFPGARAGLATSVARALLAGPPDYLRGAVTIGVPQGTTLGVEAVPTTGGVAQVDLSSRALTAPPEARQQLFAELQSTLRQLPNVTQVSLTAGGAVFPVPGVAAGSVGGDLGYTQDVPVAGPVLVLGGGRLMQVDPSTGELVAEHSGRFSSSPDVAGLRALAAGPGSDVLVGVDSSGTRLVTAVPEAPREVLATGADLTSPVVDRAGWAWGADRRQVGEVIVAPASSAAAAESGTGDQPARAARLRPSWLAGRHVQALDVARDGARLAVVSSGPDGARRLDVAGVVRDPTGRPTGLAAARAAGQSLVGVQDVSWADRTTLAVLAGPAGALQPFQVDVGGVVHTLPTLAGATAIWAGDDLRSVYVATARGEVVVRSGNGWRRLGPGLSVTIPP